MEAEPTSTPEIPEPCMAMAMPTLLTFPSHVRQGNFPSCRSSPLRAHQEHFIQGSLPLSHRNRPASHLPDAPHFRRSPTDPCKSFSASWFVRSIPISKDPLGGSVAPVGSRRHHVGIDHVVGKPGASLEYCTAEWTYGRKVPQSVVLAICSSIR